MPDNKMINSTVSLADKKKLILKQKVFAEFTDEEAKMLAGLLTENHFSASTVIVNEGERVDCVYLIVTGTVEVQHVTLEADQPPLVTSLATLGPGESIGLNEVGFFSLTGKRTATVVAITDVMTLRLGITEFKGFALSNSHVSQIMREQALSVLSEGPNSL